jgi:hypothetical protein
VLSQRALNRTLLARQLLAIRADCPALEAIGRLVALQSQDSNAPYVGLWSRLRGFRHDGLTALLQSRGVVRAPLLRGTQHLVAGADYSWLRPLVGPILERAARRGAFGRATVGLEPGALEGAARDLLADRVLTRPQLGRLLAERFPGRDPGALAWSVQYLLPVVHPPPSGTWGAWWSRGPTPFALAEAWLGRPLAAAPAAERLVRRYLAAFGPATALDVQAWSGLTGLGPVVERMRPALRILRDEGGRELVDDPDAPLAGPDDPAPVRFLPPFDNLILGHADRSRVIGDEERGRVVSGSLVRPTVLVDGFVAGTWSLDGPRLEISPFRPLRRADAAAVEDEAGRLLDFVAPDGPGRDVAIV